MHRTWIAVALIAGIAACGKKDDPRPETQKPVEPALPALALPALGVDSLKKVNYVYGDGAKDYERALAAYKATPRDYAGVRSACEAALAKDGGHLDAHRLLAGALAQANDYPAATEHLLVALGGDWLRWGPTLGEDPDLTGYLASPQGKALTALGTQISEQFLARAKAGVPVLGRRAPFKWPAKPGVQWVSPRGELYAYDLESKRFLRLTHTDHSVAAVLPSPSGEELVVIGFDKVEVPDAKDPKAKDAPPLLARTWVETIDPKTWATTGKRATFAKARAVAVHYGVGDQLLVTTFAPASPPARWGLGAPTTFSIDRATGKTAKTATPAELGPRAQVSADEVRADLPVAGIEATWEGDPAMTTGFKLAGGKPVAIPESGKAPRASFAVSPAGKRVAFATWADPCAKDGAVGSLYAVDGATGALKHILTAASRFGVRWLDDDRLVYEDDAGGLRLFDAAAGREVLRIEEKGGLALRALSPSPKPLCRQEPPAIEVEEAPAGAPPAMPPEEPGPATTP